MSLLEIAGELYGLPPAEFTGARDARAKELKGGPDAAAVKRLRKPSIAAWAVNLLARHESTQVEQMLAVGAALRAAQSDLDAPQLRALTTQRRQLTTTMATRAVALARERGVTVGTAAAEQVQQTLTAAMIDEGVAAAVRSGLLVTALTATGIGPTDVAGAVALPEAVGHEAPAAPSQLRAVKAPSRDAEKERVAQRRAAQQALQDAQRRAKTAEAKLTKASRLVHEQQAGVLQAQAELDELRRRLAEAEGTAQHADEALTHAEEAQSAAEDEVGRAHDALEDARLALEQR